MPLTIYKRGKKNIYHYRGTLNGDLVRGTCQTTDRKTALKIAAAKEREIWQGNIDGPEAILTFAEAVGHYRKADGKNRYVDSVAAYWKDSLVKHITAGAVRQAAIVLYPNACGATRNTQVIVPTQAVINACAKDEMCRPLKVERFTSVTKKKTPVTWEWVQAFMAAANPHLGALACFMFLTGARISEALAVRWKDIDLAAATVTIRQTKLGGEERSAHMPRPLAVAIANIEGERDPEGKVFQYSSRSTTKPQWNAACKRAGIERYSFHCCRHGFATSMLHKGVDVITTAELGGWKDAQHVFKTYGHANKDKTLADRIVDTPATQSPEHETESITKSTA